MSSMMPFQKNAAARLEAILETESRAFLADEAGLGKTFTATKVMVELARKQWAKQEQEGGKPTPFFVLYVAPNDSLLAKCCEDIQEKTGDLLHGDESFTHEMTRISLAGEIIKKHTIGKKIVLIANSIYVMGIRGVVGETNERKGYQDWLESKDSKAWRDSQEAENVARIQGELESGDPWMPCVGGNIVATNDLRTYLEYENLKHFGLVLFDEYHRYFQKLNTSGKSVLDAENPLRLLFISATPYQTYLKDTGDSKWGKRERDYLDELGDADESLDKLPTFEEFAALFCAIPGKNTSNVKNYLIGLEEKFKESPTEKNRDELQSVLEIRMVRNERPLLSADSKPEPHVEERVKLDTETLCCIGNMRQQYLAMEQLEWAKNIPWLLTFSTKYQAAYQLGKEKSEEQLDSYTSNFFDCLQDACPIDSLFLYDKYGKVKDCISTLPQQNLAFRQMCQKQLQEDMAQLIWMPPTVPAYEIPKESIFAQCRDYSKLIVFAEYVYMQRGGSLLLSEYAQRLNGDPVPQQVKLELHCPEEHLNKKADEVCSKPLKEWKPEDYWVYASPAGCARRLGMDAETARDVEKIFNAYFARNGVKQALWKWMTVNGYTENTTEGLLRYCAEGNLYAVLQEWKSTLKNEENIKESLERVLGRKPSVTCVQTMDRFQNVRNLFGTKHGIPIPGLKNQVEQYEGIEKSCGFAERLTYDMKDNGGKSGSLGSKESHKQTIDAFNSPFYPMVLFVGQGAQEGLDFHQYCSRIMHFTLPRGAVSFDQRQGRIDRFRSLLVRRRAWELAQKQGLRFSGWNELFQALDDRKQTGGLHPTHRNDALFPNWQIKEIGQTQGVDRNGEGQLDGSATTFRSDFHFERLVPVTEFTDEQDTYDTMENQLKSYRSSFGYGTNIANQVDLSTK